MFICKLAALKTFLKKNETEKEIVKVFNYARDGTKNAGKQIIGMIKLLNFILCLSARLTITSIFSF